jgi:hypothetical protein
MESLLGYCGIECSTCPIHVASLETNETRKMEKKTEVAKMFSEHYSKTVTPEEINDCDGCTAGTGRIFSQCANCTIRNCAVLKNIKTCADCNNYACSTLLTMFKNYPVTKERLEEIRKIRGN